MKWVMAFVLAVLVSRGKANAPRVYENNFKNTAALAVSACWAKAALYEVPVLCYHDFSLRYNKETTLSYPRFEAHIRSLADSGYVSVLPEQLYAYIKDGKPLPPKPVMISFDGGCLSQYTMATTVLEQYGFRGVFFILPAVVDKPHYMSCTMLNDLACRGHAIGMHSYDRQALSHLHATPFIATLKEPKIFLENAIHNKVDCFAYSNGVWTAPRIRELERDGYRMAFQLQGNASPEFPLFTVRRLQVSGHWSAATLHRRMQSSFNRPRAGLM